MPAINTTREVTTSVVTAVQCTWTQDETGLHIFLNGEKALSITSQGYLRRHRGLTPAAGVRRLPDGRIAIKPKANAGDAPNDDVAF